MENTTVDDVLDEILHRFPGLIVYEECRRPNGALLISIEFESE